MLRLQRHNDIIRLLREKKELTVKEISGALYCSAATVRRDLEELESRGLLKRSFGGAVLNEGFFDQLPLAVRGVRNIAEKQRIAAKAARLIRPGDTIFIDSSSTTYFLAPHLKGIEDLTVITNNPHLNIVLSEMRVRNFCTGGEMLTSSVALVGSDAEKFIRGIRADTVFFSARGADGVNITDSSKAERDIKLAMIEGAKRKYFLADRSKNGLTYPYVVCPFDTPDMTVDEERD